MLTGGYSSKDGKGTETLLNAIHSQALQVAVQRVGCHGARLLQGVALGDAAGQRREGDDKPALLGWFKQGGVIVSSGHLISCYRKECACPCVLEGVRLIVNFSAAFPPAIFMAGRNTEYFNRIFFLYVFFVSKFATSRCRNPLHPDVKNLYIWISSAWSFLGSCLAVQFVNIGAPLSASLNDDEGLFLELMEVGVHTLPRHTHVGS